MDASKGIAIGFVAGLVVASVAVLLLRNEAAPSAQGSAQVADLNAKIDRLERSVAQLSSPTRAPSPAVAAGGIGTAETAPAVDAEEERSRLEEQQRVIATADAKVEEAIQTGQWSLEQSRELDRLTVDLPPEERRRIHTRLTAAINNDQIKLKLH
jgi:outer membrane murein-binding lipoprotein Lpp